MFRANVEIPLGLRKGTTCGFVHKEHALCISLSGMKLCLHQTTQSLKLSCDDTLHTTVHELVMVLGHCEQHSLRRIWLDTLLVSALPLLFA